LNRTLGRRYRKSRLFQKDCFFLGGPLGLGPVCAILLGLSKEDADFEFLSTSCPSPPLTEYSTEGVIPPAVPGKLTVNNKARTTMCIKDTLPVGPEISGGTKSEPCTPHTERYHDIRTRDIEACVAKVDVLGWVLGSLPPYCDC
jgi:hypothetical protein